VRVEDFLAVMFLLENALFIAGGFTVLMVRLLRKRAEKKLEEEESRVLSADGQQQIAEMKGEITQMREMMADFLLDMHAERNVSAPSEPLKKGADGDR
jgi:hypothetical protein